MEGQDSGAAEEAIWKVLETWSKRREFTSTEMFTQMLLASTVQKLLAEETAFTDPAQG